MHCLMILISTLAVTVYAAGPTKPIYNLGAEYCGSGIMFADEVNKCWYHQCVADEYGGYRVMPRLCASGSKVGDKFVAGRHNPCTLNFDSSFGYECMSNVEASDDPPPCAVDGLMHCYNDGILTYEAEKCWCLCDIDWQGDFDCSKPTGFYDPATGGGNICRGGQPDKDHCADNPCKNGGKCYNLCRDFWCECPERHLHTYLGKRCETSYGEDVPKLNGNHDAPLPPHPGSSEHE